MGRVAHDPSLRTNALTWLAGKSPDLADFLEGLLAEIGVDRTKRPFNEPALIHDMQRQAVADVGTGCGESSAGGHGRDVRKPNVNRRDLGTPPQSVKSDTCCADRRRDPVPNNIQYEGTGPTILVRKRSEPHEEGSGSVFAD